MKSGEMKTQTKCVRINFYFEEHQSKLSLTTTILTPFNQKDPKKASKNEWMIFRNNITLNLLPLKLFKRAK